MSFNSLSRLLNKLEQEYPQWDSYRQYCHLLDSWRKVVSSPIALHTRPLYLSQGVLSVAAASASWAQTLSLQRFMLIKKLSPFLDEPLVDMRFSSAQWTLSSPSAVSSSHGESFPNQVEIHPSNCPSCQALIKPFEIERWGVCACCIAQIWSI